jgi:predicted lipoprotein
LHKRVREDVLSNFKRDEAVGKTVTFWGAFTLETLDNIRITPVILEVGE